MARLSFETVAGLGLFVMESNDNALIDRYISMMKSISSITFANGLGEAVSVIHGLEFVWVVSWLQQKMAVFELLVAEPNPSSV